MKSVQQILVEEREALIEDSHEGWKSVVKSAEFVDWFKTQDESIRKLAASSRPRDAIRLLDAFNASAEDEPSAGSQNPTRSNPAQRRLQNAVPATRGGGSNRQRQQPTSAQQAFEDGYNGR